MTTFHVYDQAELNYLGTVHAADADAAYLLAACVWSVALKLTTFRLTLARRLAV
jgi:hypothetical protein